MEEQEKGREIIKMVDKGKEERPKAAARSTVIVIGIAAASITVFVLVRMVCLKYYSDYLAPGWHSRKEGMCYRIAEENRYAQGMEEIDGKCYCFGEDTYLLYGWIEYNSNVYYADETGAVVKGMVELDGKFHYFDENTGVLLTGWREEAGGILYYLEDGTRAEGYRNIDGKEYKFDTEGFLYEGFDETEKGVRYFTSEGLAEGLLTIDNARYYFLNTYLQYGLCEIGGYTYYFGEDGKMQTGWLTIDEDRYFFNEDGTMAVDTQVGIYDIGSDGIASKAKATEENLDAYLDYILDTYGRTPEAIYDIVLSTLRYKLIRESSMEQMACYAVNTGTGACWHYAALDYLLLERAGYGVYFIRGTYTPNGNTHCFLYVQFPDGWYYMDCMHAGCGKMTEAQCAAQGFAWDKSGLPVN